MFDKLTAEDLTREADDYNAAREFEAAAEWSWCDCPSCAEWEDRQHAMRRDSACEEWEDHQHAMQQDSACEEWESHRATFRSGDLGFRIFQD